MGKPAEIRRQLVMIGVVGAGECDQSLAGVARAVGELLAQKGAALVCGGLGGVMESAAMGARSKGGLTIGILPGSSREDCNPYINIPIVTDMGHARNVIIAHTAQALVAVGGGHGTLSEISMALKLGKTVSAYGTWSEIKGVIPAFSAESAVEAVFTSVS